MAMIAILLMIILAAMFIGIIPGIHGKSCPGYCTSDLASCKAQHGKIIGYCTNEKACCDPIAGATGSCGSHFMKNMTTTYFKSPNYPGKSSGDMNCEFKVDLDEEKVIGIRIEFLKFETDGLRYGHGRQCDSDMFFIKGFGNWAPPARCGALTGYSTFIDRRDTQVKEMKTLTLLTLMSSPSYIWHIKITQVSQKSTKDSGSGTGKASRSVNQGNDDQTDDSYTSDAYGPVNLNLTMEMFEDDFDADDETIQHPEPNPADQPQGIAFAESDHHVLDFEMPLIVNGEDTAIGDVPWQASLRMFYDPSKYDIEAIQKVIGENCSITEGAHFCGGSIISDQYILTAAHCFFGTSKTHGMTDLSMTRVILGDTNRCQENYTQEDAGVNATKYEIETVTFHYAYDDHLFDSDIALIKLKEKIKFNGNVQIIQLAEKDDDFTGERALVSGWGMDTIEDPQSDLPEVLQSSNEFIVQNQTYCRKMLRGSFGVPTTGSIIHMKYAHIYAGVFCTASKNASAVEVFTGQGDSGGPLVVLRNGTEKVQAGIVSYALTNRYSASKKSFNLDYFQSVALYRPWIDLAQACTK